MDSKEKARTYTSSSMVVLCFSKLDYQTDTNIRI